MELLTEKYRPKKIEDLVLISEEFGETLRYWKSIKTIGCHLLLYGPPGTGKSSCAKVILNELEITDYIIINGSDKTGIDDTRKVIEYASVPSIGGNIKVVVFEEFERLSPQAQDSLKYVLEQYSDWCRFIFTTNNINKVTQPILSRCEVFAFTHLDVKSYTQKILDILTNEKITFSEQDVIEYINQTYPDLRKCINLINQNALNGKLLSLKGDEVVSSDKYKAIFDYIHKKANTLDTQKFLASGIKDDEFDYCYKTLYNNLKLITDDVSKWDNCLIIIANYLYKNSTVAFKDLNLMACLSELRNV